MKNTESANKIEKVISSSIKEISETVNANVVVGKTIYNEQDVIIPISKVTFSFLTGSGEYGQVRFAKKGAYPMSAGSGTIVSVKPAGFLVKDKSGKYKFLSVPNDSVDKLVDMTSEYIAGFNNANN